MSKRTNVVKVMVVSRDVTVLLEVVGDIGAGLSMEECEFAPLANAAAGVKEERASSPIS